MSDYTYVCKYNNMPCRRGMDCDNCLVRKNRDNNDLRGDLISRQEAIDAVNTWDKFGVDERGRIVPWNEGLEPYVHLRDVVIAIANLPSANVRENRTGEWVSNGKQMIINLENAREQYSALGYPHRNQLKLRCSECRKITLVDESIKYEFCPHCGADMRGEQT